MTVQDLYAALEIFANYEADTFSVGLDVLYIGDVLEVSDHDREVLAELGFTPSEEYDCFEAWL